MLISERFEGSRAPFEGDRLLMIRSLPVGAQVTNTSIILTPISPPGGALFEEIFSFTGEQGDWGARKWEASTFSEVDFHARRTLIRVAGNGMDGASLQVDIGGLFVQINDLGAMSTPDDGVDDFTVDIATGGILPSLTTQKFKLDLTGGNPHIDRVDIRTTPSNLGLRLGSQPFFWARPGELVRLETVPDFSVILNAFLTEAKAKDGYYEIPLTLHSDTLCRLDVDVEIEFVQKQTALPGGISEAALAFDHSTLPQGKGGIISVQLPPGARVLAGQTTGRVRGSFGNSRVVYGPTGKFDPASAVKVTPERAQASPLIFSENLALSSLDLLLTSTSRTAELAVDLVEDLDGKPGTQSVLPTQTNLGIDSQIAGKPTWISVSLPAEVQLKTGTRLWLVAQSLRGEAEWSVVSQMQVGAASLSGVWRAGEEVAADQANGTPLGIRYTDTGGLSWRAESAPGINGPLAGMVHLRQPSARYQVPIALQVGDGDNANRVDLSRFEPLGRVDFKLDFDEFAEAINQAASASATAAPPVGEHLLNNEFEAWRRVGDIPRSQVMVVPAGSFPARVLAISPDGKLLYIADSVLESSPQILRIRIAVVDTGCHLLEDEFEIDAIEQEIVLDVSGLAVSPDGRRASITNRETITGVEGESFQGILTWVDMETRQRVGETAIVEGLVGKPVFSPDGSRLYLMSYKGMKGSILVFDVGLLEEAFLTEGDIGNAELPSIPIGNNLEPFAQVLSPDGGRLYVIVVNHNEPQTAELWIHNIASGSWMPPVELGEGEDDQYDLALNPSGTRVVVANGSTQEVIVFETRRGQRIGSISTTDKGSPVAVAVDPGGRLAFVAITGEISVVTGFDISRLTQGFLFRDVNIGLSPSDVTILPSGERLYVADDRGSDESRYYFSSLALGGMVPEEWTLTSGRVQPVCVESPYHRAAVLGDFSCAKESLADRRGQDVKQIPRTYFPSAVSQVIPVVGGVRYELSFWGLATTSEAVAEVFWYGGDCDVQQTDRLPFTAYEDDPESMKCGLERVIASGEMIEEVSNIIPFHRVAMTSPTGAELAEVRFVVPANEAAFLDRVSLLATANALSNGDLLHLYEGSLVGWSVVPEGTTGATLIAEAEGLRFRNNGAQEAALEQAAPFPAQAPFELDFTGQSDPSTSGALPRLEIAWLEAGNAQVGTVVAAEIAAQGSNRLVRRGNSLAGTVTALLRVVVPPGANLLLQKITLQEISMTTVPIYVIAQDPGELNVSDLQIVYEISPPAPPRTVPAGGLCSPTPPVGAPGQGRRGCCYCPNCGETDDLCDPQEGETPGGQPALEGECCHCGARMRQIGGGRRTSSTAQGKPERIRRASAVLTRRGTSPVVVPMVRGAPLKPRGLIMASRKTSAVLEEAVPPSSEEPTVTVELPPIGEVTGVTAEFSAALTTAGLGTLDRLAAATPSQIAAAFPEEEKAVAVRISRNARRLFKKITSSSSSRGQ